MSATNWRDTVPLLRDIGGVVFPYRNNAKHFDHWKSAYSYTPEGRLALYDVIARDRSVTGAGYRNGAGDLRDFDFDDCTAYTPVQTVLQTLGLPDDYQWVIKTASGSGYRLLFRCADHPDITAYFGEKAVFTGQAIRDFDHLEFRWRHQSVLFGQAYDKRGVLGAYQFINGTPTEPPVYVPADRVIVAFNAVAILCSEQPPKPPTQQPSKNIILTNSNLTPQQRGWLKAAVKNELSDLAQAVEGGRNVQLNEALFALFTLVGAGVLNESDFLPEARAIIQGSGLPEGEINRTIASARNAGLANPRDLVDQNSDVWGKTAPQKEAVKQKRQFDEYVPAPEVAQQPAGVPDSWRAAIFEFFGRQGRSVFRLLEAVWTCYGSFTLKDLADSSGIAYNTLWRAMKYGSALFLENCSLNSSISLHEGEGDTTRCIGQTAIRALPDEKTYQLLPYDRLVETMLKKVIAPALVERHFRVSLGEVPNATTELLTAMELPGDPDLAKAINERLDTLQTTQQKEKNQASRDRARMEYLRWKKCLSDTTSTALPEIWKSDPSAAWLVVNHKKSHGCSLSLGKAERNTGLSRSTIKRIEKRVHLIRREKYHPTGQIVTKVQELPPLEYSYLYEGFPEWATLENGEELDYRIEDKRDLVIEALNRGEKVRIDYRQAGTVDEMTDEERVAADNARRQKSKHTKKSTNSESATEFRVGHTTTFAQAVRDLWLDRMNARVITPDGEIVPINTLTAPEIALVLRGKESEVANMIHAGFAEPRERDVVISSAPVEIVSDADFKLIDYLEPGKCYGHYELKAAYFKACEAVMTDPSKRGHGAKFREAVCSLGTQAEDFFFNVIAAKPNAKPIPGALIFEEAA